jgi:hypothetical protein
VDFQSRLSRRNPIKAEACVFAFDALPRKKWRGFGNFVPEFFIDAEARGGKISRLVHNSI